MGTALVIGLGVSGQAAAVFLQKKGYRVIGIDRTKKEVEGVTVYLEEEAPRDLIYDFIILSPGVSPKNFHVEKARKKGIPVLGEIELAMRYKKGTVVGITGTNGKTTVTKLLTHILCEARIDAVSAGNVGVPFTKTLLDQEQTRVTVLELSSYQLETLVEKGLDFALILNITEDHLDRYENFLSYAKTKIRIQEVLVPDGKCIVSTDVYKEYRDLLKNPITFGEEEGDFYVKGDEIWKNDNLLGKLPSFFGPHDKLNALAAFIPAIFLGVEPSFCVKALENFEKPPHRIQFVLKENGVVFYDDSKATNVDATVQAVNGMKGPVILLAGGIAKGPSFSSWTRFFKKDKVKMILLFGKDAELMRKELSLFFNVEIVDSLEQAVKIAKSVAEAGDSVLLSPGCSSLDMFRDYTHRGQEFQRLVRGE